MKTNKRVKILPSVRASFGLALMLALTACNNPPPPQVLTKVQVDRVTVPVSLLSVPSEPAVPSGRMQSAAADYIVHLKINDDECHVDVAAIAASQQ